MIINNLLIIILAIVFSAYAFEFIEAKQRFEQTNDQRPEGAGGDGFVRAILEPIIKAIVAAILFNFAVLVGIVFVLQIVFSCIVYSHIRELRERENRKNAEEGEDLQP